MKLMSWNVRGMNSVSKQAVMNGVFCCFKGECLFIQETKMEEIDYQIIRSICPWSSFQFVTSPSVGASGGILLVWNAIFWQKMDEYVGSFSVFALLKDVRCGSIWVATSVYGPYSGDKTAFWEELNRVAAIWNYP